MKRFAQSELTMKHFVFSVFLFSWTVLWGAQDKLSLDELKGFSDTFIGLIEASKHKEALDSARPYWPLPSHEVDSLITRLKSAELQNIQAFGRKIGVEHYKDQAVGELYFRRLYFEKFEKHSMLWSITFYKTESDWIINSISNEDSVKFLFK